MVLRRVHYYYCLWWVVATTTAILLLGYSTTTNSSSSRRVEAAFVTPGGQNKIPSRRSSSSKRTTTLISKLLLLHNIDDDNNNKRTPSSYYYHHHSSRTSSSKTSTTTTTTTKSSALFSSSSFSSSKKISNSISYGEESRKYRRTVYTHVDWIKHRSHKRFMRNIISTTSSGIYKNVGREVFTVTCVSVFVMIWNMITGGYTDFAGIKHPPLPLPLSIFSGRFKTSLPVLSLPLTPFTLASSSLGLLLVFRTNTAYQRWDEARKNWGLNINHTRDLVRMGNAYYDKKIISDEETRHKDLSHLSRCTWAFVRSMKRHLSPPSEDEDDYQKEVYEELPQSQAESLLKANHRPNRALFDLSMAIENLPMHFLRKNEMHKSLTIFEDTLGGSERLLSSPVPLFYSRHTARFLSFWLFFIPFALWEQFKSTTWNSIGMIPASAILSVCLFGIEELATQMEEPFTILPMQVFCDKIKNNCNEIISWKDDGGDNDVPPPPPPAAAKDTTTRQQSPEKEQSDHRHHHPKASSSLVLKKEE